MAKNPDELSPEEIARRRDDAIRRALNTPHKLTKELIGKTERAKNQKITKRIRSSKKQEQP